MSDDTRERLLTLKKVSGHGWSANKILSQAHRPPPLGDHVRIYAQSSNRNKPEVEKWMD